MWRIMCVIYYNTFTWNYGKANKNFEIINKKKFITLKMTEKSRKEFMEKKEALVLSSVNNADKLESLKIEFLQNI